MPASLRYLLTSFIAYSLALSAMSQEETTLAEDNCPFSEGEKILFLGDSITQDGRYPALIELFYWAKYPDLDFDIINLGLNGETVSGISENSWPRRTVHDRLEITLRETKPDWVFICYGMNDGIYHPLSQRILDAYTKGMEKLIARCRQAGAKIILLTPPVFDKGSINPGSLTELGATKHGYPTPYQNYNQTLQAFGQWVLKQNATYHVDFQKPLLDYIEKRRAADPLFIFGDGVHPGDGGHFTMALATLEALGEDPVEAEKLLSHLTNLTRFPAGPPKNKPELNQDDPESAGEKTEPSILYQKSLLRHRMMASDWRQHTLLLGYKGHEMMLENDQKSKKTIRAYMKKHAEAPSGH